MEGFKFANMSACDECGGIDGTLVCSVCKVAKYCGRECQRKAWNLKGHKRECLRTALHCVVWALEVALMGTMTVPYQLALARLDQGLGEEEGKKGHGGEQRLANYVGAVYLNPVVCLRHDLFVATMPGYIVGEFPFHHVAVQSLAPFLLSSEQSKAPLFRGAFPDTTLNNVEWCRMAAHVGRFEAPTRTALVVPEDLRRRRPVVPRDLASLPRLKVPCLEEYQGCNVVILRDFANGALVPILNNDEEFFEMRTAYHIQMVKRNIEMCAPLFTSSSRAALLDRGCTHDASKYSGI